MFRSSCSSRSINRCGSLLLRLIAGLAAGKLSNVPEFFSEVKQAEQSPRAIIGFTSPHFLQGRSLPYPMFSPFLAGYPEDNQRGR
jgi:hypothetical protein